MRFVTDFNKGILGNPDSTKMWNEIVSSIPNEVFLKKDLKILNLAFGHGTEADIIVKHMIKLGRSTSDIKDSLYLLDKYSVFTKDAKRKGYTNVIRADITEWETDMKFDIVVGNPPYQDGTKEGGQNKIYNMICKTSMDLLKDDGTIAFITPTSVLKKSKRFSLIDCLGLKHVGFDADNFFDVGINICSWVVDKTYTSTDVDVTYVDGTSSKQDRSDVIYDYSIVDKDFTKIYNKLKSIMDKPNKRMFDENNFGDAVVKDPNDNHPYILHSIDKNTKQKTVFGYSRRQPFFYQKRKIIIPMTKTLTEDSILIDTDDFYVAYLCLEVESQEQIDNIKSFLLSEYFTAHATKWKNLDGYGFNYALKYLPKFNVNKKWTNEEVKEFIESYVR